MGARTMLKSKLQRVTTTRSELYYEGSCAIDEELLNRGGHSRIRANRNLQCHKRRALYHLCHSRRASIRDDFGQWCGGTQGMPGDLLIITSYGILSESELSSFEPRLVYVDSRNKIVAERTAISPQIAA